MLKDLTTLIVIILACFGSIFLLGFTIESVNQYRFGDKMYKVTIPGYSEMYLKHNEFRHSYGTIEIYNKKITSSNFTIEEVQPIAERE